MTKLEFIDKINDILIGLNTAESDALGSLYDELMRDAGWYPASEVPKEGDEVMVITTGGISASRAIYTNGIYCSVVVGKKAYYPSVEWWCYPPRKEE